MQYLASDDESLLAMIAQRDPDALAALYDRHAQTIYNLAMRIVRDPALASEVLQDTFWQAWRKADTFQHEGSVAAWLYRIARNKSLDELRRQKVRPQLVGSELSLIEQVANEAAPEASSTEALSEQAWWRHEVRQALAQLPVEQRVCLELAYYEGMTQREIAEHLATPVGTVKTRVRMGLSKLGRLLRIAGYTAEDNV